MEPQDAVMVGQKLFKIMTAIVESYSSDDHSRVDYARISQSEEFRRYIFKFVGSNIIFICKKIYTCFLGEK